MDIGKLFNSIFSFTNENSAALASVRLDFTLVKVEAPPEFAVLGSALSSRRKDVAEEGEIHRTARRLGALFEQLIPSTPKLVKAYGTRCTEIIETPDINPRGNFLDHGFFKTYVGADGTALWAAATSGIASVGVYLLACLLADAWESKEAISLWVELVKCRKEEIKSHASSGELITDASLLSAQQEITRNDLALWDSSARAWLRSAKQAKSKQNFQLDLIVKNIPVPFNSASSTYHMVIHIWQEAMKGMENLLHGRPQMSKTRSILQAMSAWQLYPNLIVIGKDPVRVSFKDELVPETGVCTMGTWTRSEDDGGKMMLWSMTLSHLHYYEGAVNVTSDGNQSRVTFNQFTLVILGAVFRIWRIRTEQFLQCAQCILSLWTHLETKLSEKNLLHGISWLRILAIASRTFLSSASGSEDQALLLLKYGKRRAKDFLGRESNQTCPLFGLTNMCVREALLSDSDENCSILYCRAIAARLSHDSSNLLIRTSRTIFSHGRYFTFYEYAMALQHVQHSMERNRSGNRINSHSHVRFLHITRHDGRGFNEEPLETIPDILTPLVKSWKAKLKAQNESAVILQNAPHESPDLDPYQSIPWNRPPLLFSNPSMRCLRQHLRTETDQNCKCFEPMKETNPITLHPVFNRGTARIFVIESKWTSDHLSQPSGSIITDEITMLERAIETDYAQIANNISQLSPERIYDYLCTISLISGTTVYDRSLSNQRRKIFSSGVFVIAGSHLCREAFVDSLQGLDQARQLYDNLEGATVSLSVINRCLQDAHWIADCSIDLDTLNFRMSDNDYTGTLIQISETRPWSREQSLSCVIYFEAGGIDLEIDHLAHVLAVSSGNSLFVPTRLLTDPYVLVPEHKLRRIVGNIGKSGICLLVAPETPKIRPLSNRYDVVTHAAYDMRREDNFKGTTMHLSFSEWEAPLMTGTGSRTIDRDVTIVESIISVVDEGRWVADLNILAIDFQLLTRLSATSEEHSHSKGERMSREYTSIDSWEEFLDKPETVGIFRARGNWVARLAAVSLMFQTDEAHYVAVCDPKEYCLACLEEKFNPRDIGLEPHGSGLPLVCID